MFHFPREGNLIIMHMRVASRKRHPVLDSIQHSPIATVVSDPKQEDNPLIAVNQAFLDLTGYDADEVLGRNCRFLRGADTETGQTERLRQAIQERRSTLAELVNYRKDGSPFRNAVVIAPLFDDAGRVEYFVGSQIEVVHDEESIAVVRQQEAARIVERLSPRQREILRHMAQGFRTKQIAYMLSLSEKTVQMHRMLMFKKLSTSNAADAVRIAVEAGL
ncbi:PAS domain [Sphingomonadaceae bacterium]|jgi:PAS domain S-box-containing protein|uniref:PAS domain-containing protein n=1 Tax=Sphingorhabdus sp. TaxID=1902408 RepID=UPI0037CBD6A1|nr:PAS domain-containing protein [Sphingomonadales bacterium]